MRSLLALAAPLLIVGCYTSPASTLPPASTAPESLLLDVANGARTLASLVDPVVGFVHVDFSSSMDDDRPREQTATALCGAAMTPTLDELAAHLREALQFEEARLRCDGLVCVDPPRMEFDSERTFRFEFAPDGRVRLASVTRIDPFTPEEMVRDDRARAAAAERAASDAGCHPVTPD